MAKMKPKTLAALRGSIRKWERIVNGTGQELGYRNCPLCKLFYDQKCKGCPVRLAAKRVGCANTPYDEWKKLGQPDEAGTDMELACAAKEVRFLRSLLPTQ